MPPSNVRDFDVTPSFPGFTIAQTSGFKPIIHDLESQHEPRCPHCSGSDLRKKDKAHHQVWHEGKAEQIIIESWFQHHQ